MSHPDHVAHADLAGPGPIARYTGLLLLLLAGSGPLAAQSGVPVGLLADGFEAGSTREWWPNERGLVAPATCARPLASIDTAGATVVGSGFPGSCDEAALDDALASHNGQIRFDCGPSHHTITVSGEKVITNSLVLDGGGTVTLAGGGATRILGFRPPFGTSPLPTLTLQNLTLREGSTSHLPGTTTANGGAAVYRASGGHLQVIDSSFVANTCPTSGQDVAGGAIYAFGEGVTTIVGGVFVDNRCASGGALGGLGTAGNHLTVVDSVFATNAATGSGGNPGNGGNGGAIYLDGANQNVLLCGARLLDNRANARGGGLFRVSNNGVGGMTVDRSLIAGNFSPDSADSQAGGLYLQGLQVEITASTIARNAASSVGGVFVATNPGTQTLTVANTTIADNLARTGLGAGLTVASGIGGSLTHVTIARNANVGPTSFASALAGGSGLSVANSLIADNAKIFTWEDHSCNVTHAGAGNLQWPATNAGGEAERPCAGVTFVDPLLGPLRNEGGATPTIRPAAGGVDGMATSGCAARDQRGGSRPTPCTPGAVEIP